MNWTVNRIAHFQASALGLSEEEKTSLHRTVRNLVTKDVVESVADEADSRGTRLLNDEQAAAVVLLVPLSRMAMDVRGLREVANFMRSMQLDGNATEIGKALAAIKDGKCVKLVHELRVDRRGGKLKPRTFFVVEEDGVSGEVQDILDAEQAAFFERLATVEVRASALLRPFLS